jgi:hypothetical protein
MEVRWHLVAWVGLVAGLTVWMWPLDPTVSFMDIAQMRAPGSGAGNTLDAMFSSQPIEGTALLRSWIGGILIGGTVAAEIGLSRLWRRQHGAELPEVSSVAGSGYSSGG